MDTKFCGTRSLGRLLFLCLAVVSLVGGCGQSDTSRYRFSGVVNYQGKPVPIGTIMFEPDTSKGNAGAAGSTAIIDGKFDSASNGSGFIGGPQLVTIQGFDGKVVNDDFAPYGTPIGKGKSYIQEFDFPNADVEIEIEMADKLK